MPPPEMSIPINQAIVICGVLSSDGLTVIPLAVDADGNISVSAVAGGATAANQATEIARLDTVITKLNGGLPTALGSGGGVKVDGSGTALPVSIASLPALAAGSNTIGKVDQGAAGLAAWKVDGSAVTQPVSGSVTATLTARVPRVAHLASAALPAAGAYTNQSAYAIPDGAKSVLFLVTYTRGAAGGYPKHRILLGNGTEEGPPVVIDGSITVSQPNGTRLSYLDTIEGPHVADASPITYGIIWSDFAGATTIRLLTAEVGQTATPGTCAIGLTAGY